MKHDGLTESVRQRLLNHARHNGEAFDFVLSQYGIERFLYRLSLSDEAGRFILKGATLFHVWNRKMHRPTRDLDLLDFGPDDLDSVRKSILVIMRIEVPEDALWFDESSLVVGSIRDDMTYGGVRANFLAKLGNVRIPVQVDVGFGDVIVPAPEMREYPALLSGMPTASLRVYPVTTVIAEKFEALVRLDAQNSRMKDFYDLAYLLSAGGIDAALLSKALQATFERRNTELPCELPTGLSDAFARDKQLMWLAFLRKNGLVDQSQEFSQIVNTIRAGLEWVWRK
ncbi:MAG: nucleotidyl transferase AbiEii/AbiGii toxin family protein [Verrucomicrobiota bacterium]